MKSIQCAVLLLVIVLISLVNSCSDSNNISKLPKKDWWENAQFYQIYPRSFKDSNGDGIGDLKGITSKLEHLKDIGVTATWLSPIFKSPMVDFGYDISNFYDIQDEYGTLEDFGDLVKKADSLGIKIILDFVPNHSSNENEWFKMSVNREPGYEDFYVWHDGYPDPKNSSNRLPPSNWLQAFRGSAWEWNVIRKQFYLHQFAVQQPDLNYRNPKVVETMKGVLTYWLDKGVYGFRVDAVPWCFEVPQLANGSYPDEPLSGYTNDTQDSGYLRHIYTQDQQETVDMVYQWRKLMDDYQQIHGGDTRILMIETYSDLDYVMKMYGNATTKGAQIPFNFQFILNGNELSNAKDLTGIIDKWLNKMPPTKTPNWVMGNHDQHRVGDRYGADKIDTMNMILMMLPGISISYNGEEIGMLDVQNITWEQTKDPAACNSNPSIYQKFSRDPQRTPFQWDTTTSAGFSSNISTWLPVAENYKSINVDVENKASKSHLKVYKDLVKLRQQSNTLKYGELSYSAYNEDVLVVERYLEGYETLVMIANIQKNKQTVDLSKLKRLALSSTMIKIVSSASDRNPGIVDDPTKFMLAPYEAVILGSK